MFSYSRRFYFPVLATLLLFLLSACYSYQPTLYKEKTLHSDAKYGFAATVRTKTTVGKASPFIAGAVGAVTLYYVRFNKRTTQQRVQGAAIGAALGYTGVQYYEREENHGLKVGPTRTETVSTSEVKSWLADYNAAKGTNYVIYHQKKNQVILIPADKVAVFEKEEARLQLARQKARAEEQARRDAAMTELLRGLGEIVEKRLESNQGRGDPLPRGEVFMSMTNSCLTYQYYGRSWVTRCRDCADCDDHDNDIKYRTYYYTFYCNGKEVGDYEIETTTECGRRSYRPDAGNKWGYSDLYDAQESMIEAMSERCSCNK